MELALFQFIDDIIKLYRDNMGLYMEVESILNTVFRQLIINQDDTAVSLQTRIKQEESLREKLIRKQFYLDYDKPEEALDNLHDLIGITVQCRFIRNEMNIYHSLYRFFEMKQKGYARCRYDDHLFMNLSMPQPQLQRNGFTIYRLDGYYILDGRQVNYELQIKSLVHAFWSEIEHEVVYKNPDFVAYDSFNKSMLGAIRDNLDIVDRQLEIMYKQISEESSRAQIGMDDKGFKIFVASSINELVNRKMKESVGFTTDFRKCSAILAQFLYIRHFVNGEHNREKMVDYLDHLNYLSETGVDFRIGITLDKDFHSDKPFCESIGRYWQSVINSNFQWHVFFVMLFGLHPGDHNEIFASFCSIIRMLIIQPGWYAATFQNYSAEDAKYVQDLLERVLAETMISIGSIKIVHEDMLYDTMSAFRAMVTAFEQEYPDFADFKNDEEMIVQREILQINSVFQ